MVHAQESSLVGKVLDDRYEVLELIGAGGVGEVYRARLLKLDRLVAMKVLHEALVENAEFVAGSSARRRPSAACTTPTACRSSTSGWCSPAPIWCWSTCPATR